MSMKDRKSMSYRKISFMLTASEPCTDRVAGGSVWAGHGPGVAGLRVLGVNLACIVQGSPNKHS